MRAYTGRIKNSLGALAHNLEYCSLRISKWRKLDRSQVMIDSRAHLFLLTLLILALVWIAAAGTNADSIWYDEYLSLRYSGALNDGPSTIPGTIDRILDRSKGQVPFYYIVLSVWGNIAGWSAFSARVLSLSFGLLSVAWIYRLGADLHSSRAGFFSALLLAGSAFFIYYLHEIRAYSLLVLELVILLSLYLRILRGGKSRLLQGSFVFVTVAMLHSHAFMAPIALAFGLYHFIYIPKTPAWEQVVHLALVCGVLYIPWAWYTFDYVVGRSLPEDPTFFRTNAALIFSLLSAFSNGIWVFLLLPVYSIRVAKRDRLLRLLWVLAICYLTVLLSLHQVTHSLSQIRYFAPLLPLFALLGGITCSFWVRYKSVLYSALVVWCVSGFLLSPNFGKTHYLESEYSIFHIDFPFRQVTAEIRSDAYENDAVIFGFSHHRWALEGVISYYLKGFPARYTIGEMLSAEDKERVDSVQLNHFLGAAGRVYFVDDRTMESSDYLLQILSVLSGRYFDCGRLWHSEQASIHKYARTKAWCGPSAPPLFRFGSEAALVDFVHEATADGHHFYSTWSSQLPAETFSFSLRFWDSRGSLIHQIDNGVPVGEFNYRIDHVPLAIFPPGETVRVDGVIYNWRTGERLRTTASADIFELGTINT